MKHTPMKLKDCAIPGYSLLEIGPYNGKGEPQSIVQLPTSTVIEIVMACNSHDLLVAACKAACKWIAVEQYDGTGRQLREALAAAGETA